MNKLEKWILDNKNTNKEPALTDSSSIHLNTALVKEKLNKLEFNYLLLYCIAHCAKTCFKNGYLMSPNSYVLLFQYGPLLKLFLKTYITNEQVMLSRE